MIPFRFGPPARQLYGVFHPPAEPSHPASGVLLCSPFGQEAVRTHRFYRIMAERLARAGIAVLRFDYFGTGDSGGDDDHGDLAGWIADATVAHAELTRRARCTQAILAGARLGGTIAWFAAATLEGKVDGLLLWEPVVDGAAYLRELGERHAEFVASMRGDARVPDVPTEVLGFTVGAQLVSQLRALTPEAFAASPVSHVALVARGADVVAARHAEALRAAGVDVRSRTHEHRFDFTSDEAMNTALVPAESLQLLVTQVEELVA